MILHVVFCHANFFKSAKHTFRKHSAQFAFDDLVTVCKVCSVKRNGDSLAANNGHVGDNLYGFRSDVDFSHAQTIGIGMLFDIHDFADHNGRCLSVLINDFFDFKADSYEFF